MTYMGGKADLRVVGTRPVRPDGVDKVTGRANFGADLRLPGVDMLLGMDFLASHQVWISYATGRLFLR